MHWTLDSLSDEMRQAIQYCYNTKFTCQVNCRNCCDTYVNLEGHEYDLKILLNCDQKNVFSELFFRVFELKNKS